MTRKLCPTVYIVPRDDWIFGRPELDVFDDYDAAKRWADVCGTFVDEQVILDEAFINEAVKERRRCD